MKSSFYKKIIEKVSQDLSGQSIIQYLNRGPEHEEINIKEISNIQKSKVADFTTYYKCYAYYRNSGYEHAIAWDNCGCHILPTELQLQLRKKIEEKEDQKQKKISSKIQFLKKIGFSEEIISKAQDSNKKTSIIKEAKIETYNRYSKKKIAVLGLPCEKRKNICKKLSNFYNVKHIDIDDIEDFVKNMGFIEKEEVDFLKEKNIGLIINIINSIYDGYILEGFPINNEIFSYDNFETISFIDMDLENVVKKHKNIRWCKTCFRIYDLIKRPPLSEEEKCDRCGSKTIIRDEDTEKNLREKYLNWRTSFNDFFDGDKYNKIILFKDTDDLDEICKNIHRFKKEKNDE